MTGSSALHFAVSGLVAPSEREHFRRADDGVDRIEIEHAVTEGIGRAIALQGRVEVARGMSERAHDGAGEDHEAKAERRQFRSREDRRLSALDHVGHQRRPIAERAERPRASCSRVRGASTNSMSAPASA